MQSCKAASWSGTNWSFGAPGLDMKTSGKNNMQRKTCLLVSIYLPLMNSNFYQVVLTNESCSEWLSQQWHHCCSVLQPLCCCSCCSLCSPLAKSKHHRAEMCLPRDSALQNFPAPIPLHISVGKSPKVLNIFACDYSHPSFTYLPLGKKGAQNSAVLDY